MAQVTVWNSNNWKAVLVTNLTRQRCPDLYQNLPVLERDFLNSSEQDLETELPTTFCNAAQLLTDTIWSTRMYSFIACAVVAFGLISSILSLIVLTSKHCKEITYIYHRVINVADLLCNLFTLAMAMEQLFPNEILKSYVWRKYQQFFTNKLDHTLLDFIELIVGWISIERTFCYFPRVFHRINRRSVATGVVGVSFLVSTAINVPIAFVFTVVTYQNGMYGITFTSFGNSTGFETYVSVTNAFYFIRAAVILVGTVGTIVILFRITRNKLVLIGIIGHGSVTSQNLHQSIKSNHSMCILQLCESLPLIVACCIGVFMRHQLLIFGDIRYMNVSFSQAQEEMRQFRRSLCLILIKRTADMVAHTLHFYLYIAFSKKIRYAAIRMFLPASRTTSTSVPTQAITFNP